MAITTSDPTDVPKIDSFAFADRDLEEVRRLIGQYPAGRQASAVIALLDLAQRRCGGWLPRVAMDAVAKLLDMAPIRVYEVATFYTMFSLRPRGKYLLQVCTTTPCWLRGSNEVMQSCREHTGVGVGETSSDGLFTTVEVECLGACVNAPVIQINDDFYEDLDAASTARVLLALKRGESPKAGPQVDRLASAPIGGRTTLMEDAGDASTRGAGG